MKYQVFFKHRCNFLKKMQPSSIALFFSSFSKEKSLCFPQQSDFFYLTGLKEKNILLLIIKYNEKINDILFFTSFYNKSLKKKIKKNKYLNFSKIFLLKDIKKKISQLILKLNNIYIPKEIFDYEKKEIFFIFKSLKKTNLKIFYWNKIIHEMRLFKSKEELNFIKKACIISVKAHNYIMNVCKPGMYEYQLAYFIEKLFYKLGAKYTAYPIIVGSGKNSCIIHYTKKSSIMDNGNLVIVDAGAKYNGYASDITRTFPVNKNFNKYQYKIYNIVLLSLNKALSLYKPGTTIYNVTLEVLKIKIINLIKLGILKGNIDELIRKKEYLKFFMHSLSHWVGIDVHDVGEYENKKRILFPGMVLAVEPAIYIKHDANVPKEYQGISVRLEDTIVITKTGNDVLTKKAIKNPLLIEKLMNKKY